MEQFDQMEQFPSQNLTLEPEKWMAPKGKRRFQFLETFIFRFHVKLGEDNPEWVVGQGFLSKESGGQGKMSRNQSTSSRSVDRARYIPLASH